MFVEHWFSLCNVAYACMIIDCRRSLKGPNGIMWASFFALCIAAAASVCDCSMCSKQDDIVCHTSLVNVPGGNSSKMSSSSTFGM